MSATTGALRLSKGAWLFAPDGVDVLLRVTPRPAPSPEGFFSRAISARLEVNACSQRPGGAALVDPRTGVPARVVGRVVDVSAGACVVDAGLAFVVHGVDAHVGDVVEVDVDVDAGVTCVVLP